MQAKQISRLVGFWLILSVLATSGEGCTGSDAHQFAHTVSRPEVDPAPKSRIQAGFLPDPVSRASHSSSTISLPDGSVRAFWMYGREGARETVIASARFDISARVWSEFSIAADVSQTTRDIGARVRKVGNAVPILTEDGKLHLVYVVTSIGGWAGSYLVYRSSEDRGTTWGPASRIRTSPFLNMGTLVRSAPIAFRDGTIGLPVYHELLGKYSELLHLDSTLRVLDRHRIKTTQASIQPALVTIGPDSAVAMMRNPVPQSPRAVLASVSKDGGQSWVASGNVGLPNPGSPVAVMRMTNGDLMAVLNPNETKRRELALAVKSDAGQWQVTRYIESAPDAFVATDVAKFAQSLLGSMARVDGSAKAVDRLMVDRASSARCLRPECDAEYSYPYLIRLRDGRILLTYTWNRVAIRWIVFDERWVQEGLESSVSLEEIKR